MLINHGGMAARRGSVLRPLLVFLYQCGAAIGNEALVLAWGLAWV